MAQEPYTKLEEAASSTPRRSRCSTTYVQVVCQISCIVLLIICVVSIERRLSFLEHRLDSMAEELKNVHSKHKGGLGRHGAVALDKRPINDSTTAAKKVRSLKRRSPEAVRLDSLGVKGVLPLSGESKHGSRPEQPYKLHAHHAEQAKNEQWLPGVVYYHWGRNDCPGSATLVYHGYMASNLNSNQGGGSNNICLPSNTTYPYPPSPQGGTIIYGTKYHTKFHGFKNDLNNNLAVCAACYVEYRGSQIMIPATNVCPVAWALEYRGYLMSSRNGNIHSSEFVCVDEEAQPGGTGFSEGATLNMVESLCGTLPCKLLGTRHQLSCVVCTK